MKDDSSFIAKESCPECGSRDNLARYSDGHAYCFGCHHYEPGDNVETTNTEPQQQNLDLIDCGTPMALSARGLSQETCDKWGYGVAMYRGSAVQVANYRNDVGRVIAQKVRWANKEFRVFGDAKNMGLYGMHLWRDNAKRLVITEGEIDALSVSQAQGNKWPVVSLSHGAQAAAQTIKRNLDKLLGFEEVVLMFDNDEPGQEAAVKAAAVFPPGRCKIATLDTRFKDANEALVAGQSSAIIDAIFGAKAYRPDGIVTISDVKAKALEDPVIGYPWFMKRLTEVTYGRRLGETIALGAGTGIGKSDWFSQQMMHDMIHLQEPVAAFMLEQGPAETLKRLAGKQAGKTFHIPDGSWTKDELLIAIEALEGNGRLFLYDSFGATDWEIIQNTIRFLAHSEGVKLFYLDHLTALAAAEDDERTGLERIMAEMAKLAKELQIIIHFVSHLSTPDGTPHEEGGRVTIRQFKGSRAIGYWSHFMFGMERNQQDEDENLRSVTTFRVLKDRYTGRATGECIYLSYDKERAMLVELDYNPYDKQDDADSNPFDSEDKKVGNF